MKVSIEMEAEDWLSVAAIMGAFMGIAASNIGNHPIAYSNGARVYNQLRELLDKAIPQQVVDEVIRRITETGTSFKAE